MPNAKDLSHDKLVAIVSDIQEALWLVEDRWDAFKEWDQDTLEEIAVILENAGLGLLHSESTAR